LEIYSLQPGTIISNQFFEISEDNLDSYLRATGSTVLLESAKFKIPSIAIAAWALGATMKAISLPEGAVHISHQITASKSVRVGEKVNCLSKIMQNDIRRGVRFLKIEIQVTQNDAQVLSEVATITIKESGSNG